MGTSGNTIQGAKGITFAGETFIVPETHDMVKTLFDPSVRKSYCETIIVALLALNFLTFWLVGSNSARIPIFIAMYVFWRLLYNFGIGFMLHQQSNHQRLVEFCKGMRVFDLSSKSILSKLARLEIKLQMGDKYTIEDYPVEFNTWLLFRKAVDLILMLDFVTFICLVIACAVDKEHQSWNTVQQSYWLVLTRFGIGIGLIVFNFWVKVNAHNTIKDYAWYWGDFFFRQINNEELIFDGVFEMVPHPMYSVGYVGYYGFALILKSYTVLIVALFGHFLQMVFLHFIENPHIDKIYGTEGDSELDKLIELKDLKNFENLKPLVGLFNFNWFRSTDLVSLIVSVTYGVIIPIIAAAARGPALAYVKPVHVVFGVAVAIKLFESVSISTLLILQSHYKTFTKFCLSNDIPVEKSLNNWSVFYNTLILLTYSSFFGLNFLFVLRSEDVQLYFTNYNYLRIFVGLLLIITQFWINASIIDLIGFFGWFYGDFFIPRSLAPPQRLHLTKAGIYRYLNNPEQIFGVCGILGVTLIAPCFENIICCMLWVTSNFIRINFIEKFHMIKVYGEREVRKDSGVTKTFKKHLIPDLLHRKDDTESKAVVNDTNVRRKSSITNSLDHFIKDLRSKNSKLSNQKILELSQGLYFENSEYKVVVRNLHHIDGGDFDYVHLGESIEIAWTSPAKVATESKDWIGLYKIAHTSYSRNKTLISSSGRWVWCSLGAGTAIFNREKLFWEEGVYEFRYHLDGKHDVAYISSPFEIKSVKIDVPTQPSQEAILTLAQTLKTAIFEVVLPQSTTSIDADINTLVGLDVLTIYHKLATMISLATEIKINSKIFLNGDDNHLTIKKLSEKLISIKNVLDELSYSADSVVTIEKKNS